MIELKINPETGNHMLILRQSDLKLWMADRRDFYFSVFENLEPIRRKVGVADIGTFVHESMKAHYLNQVNPVAAIAALANIEIEKNPFVADDLMKTADFARIIMEGYLEWIEENAVDHGLVPMKVEERITALIGTFNDIEVYVSGAIDLVLKDWYDMIWIFDHKTVDGFEVIMHTLSDDFQGQTYDFLLQSIGLLPTGFKHNQLRRVKRTPNAYPPFYNRAEIIFNSQQRLAHQWHMEGIAKQIIDSYLAITKVSGDERRSVFHREFYPHFTRDSHWKSNFLELSIATDLDPEMASDLIAGSYKQKESVV